MSETKNPTAGTAGGESYEDEVLKIPESFPRVTPPGDPLQLEPARVPSVPGFARRLLPGSAEAYLLTEEETKEIFAGYL